MSAQPERQQRRRPTVFLLLPLILFGALALLFVFRLGDGDPSKVPSALIGREVPEFDLAGVEGLNGPDGPVPGFSSQTLKQGRISVVNVWASWCAPCREEHPLLVALSQDKRFDLYGLNYKDEAQNARRFLGRFGNPFKAVGADASGRTGIDWGVYGVPETFVVGRDGRIVYKHVGPISQASLASDLMPQIEKALAGQ
ncbi:MAG: DsbE family thiol:disulfide interchange protein [Rhodobiaceae bacterium]|nr:DsbE family thiol:disulfide interchange protein [Rhodobiaceae bacterium]MCC0055538.1 DsbE family thiol:disulfide interchange protein [Rhodobiaceae bacterium]